MQWENIPDGFIAENVPVSAGEYAAELILSAPGYATETRVFEFTVKRAVPSVSLNNPEILFRSGYELSSADFTASAALGDIAVAGEFVFTGNKTLAFGLNRYELDFVPDNSNDFETVTGISLYVNGYLSAEKAAEYFRIYVVKEVDGDTVFEPLPDTGKASGASLAISVSSEVAADVAVSFGGTPLKLTDSVSGTKILTIDIRAGLSGTMVFSIQNKTAKTVELSLTPYVPDDEPDPGEPDDEPGSSGEGETEGGGSMGGNEGETGQSGGNGGGSGTTGSGDKVNVNISDDGKTTLLIIGASCGGAVLLAAIIIVIVVIVKKKKNKGVGKF